MNSINIKVLSEEIQRLKADSGQDQSELDAITSSIQKNLLPPIYSFESGVEYHGITPTITDGTISFSGTASSSTNFTCFTVASNTLVLPAGDYIFSGLSGGSSTTYDSKIKKTGSVDVAVLYDGEVKFSLSENTALGLIIHFSSGYAIPEASPIMTKFMIRKAGITNSDYEQYSKSPVALTADVSKLLCNKTDANTYMLTATVDAQGAITYSWVSTT